MPQNVAFHQGLHCLLKINLSLEKHNNLKLLTCDFTIVSQPINTITVKCDGSVYHKDVGDPLNVYRLIASNQMEDFI